MMIGKIVRANHGGHCCGMTHVYNFPSSPDAIVKEISQMSPEEQTKFRSTWPGYSLTHMEGLPEETGEERLKRVVDKIKDSRRNGIVEVVLTSGQTKGRLSHSKDHKTWREVLEGLGFREVNSHVNSNSFNRIHVFHLNTE